MPSPPCLGSRVRKQDQAFSGTNRFPHINQPTTRSDQVADECQTRACFQSQPSVGIECNVTKRPVLKRNGPLSDALRRRPQLWRESLQAATRDTAHGRQAPPWTNQE